MDRGLSLVADLLRVEPRPPAPRDRGREVARKIISFSLHCPNIDEKEKARRLATKVLQGPHLSPQLRGYLLRRLPNAIAGKHRLVSEQLSDHEQAQRPVKIARGVPVKVGSLCGREEEPPRHVRRAEARHEEAPTHLAHNKGTRLLVTFCLSHFSGWDWTSRLDLGWISAGSRRTMKKKARMVSVAAMPTMVMAGPVHRSQQA